jgi:hypothetical protein
MNKRHPYITGTRRSAGLSTGLNRKRYTVFRQNVVLTTLLVLAVCAVVLLVAAGVTLLLETAIRPGLPTKW